MSRIKMLSLVGVAAISAVAGVVLYWNTGPAPDDASTEQLKGLYQRMLSERKRLKEVSGRTGILAEEKKYSVFDEELIIRDFFRDRENGFFVDVGCAAPIATSNTYYLEHHLGWSGFGIDALEDYAAAWATERPLSTFFAYLVTSESSDEAAFFKSTSLGLSSTDRERASASRFGSALDTEEIKVPSITLTDLLDQHGVQKIDLLAMDIEGHELEALRGFDIKRFRPELVVLEGRSKLVLAHMQENGYKLIKRYKKFDRVNRYFKRREASSKSERANVANTRGR